MRRANMNGILLKSAQPSYLDDASLPFCIGDFIDCHIWVIPATSMVLEVAYVLPTIKNPSDAFPNSAKNEAGYIVVFCLPNQYGCKLGLK